MVSAIRAAALVLYVMAGPLWTTAWADNVGQCGAANSEDANGDVSLVQLRSRSSAPASRLQGLPFYSIAHMVNTKSAVDLAVGRGANALEFDVQYSGTSPDRIRHGAPCDCSCKDCLFGASGYVCCDLSCLSGDNDIASYLSHVASKPVTLAYFDNKVSDSWTEAEKADAGERLGRLIAEQLFGKGYKGRALIGVPTDAHAAFLRAAVRVLDSTPYGSRSLITMDFMTGQATTAITKLREIVPGWRAVYSVGISICSSKTFYDEISTAVAELKKGNVAEVFIWTLDATSSIKDYISRGVTGILTNYPADAASAASSAGLTLATLPLLPATGALFSAPFSNQYLAGYGSSRRAFRSLYEAQRVALADATAGGVTLESNGQYTVRAGATTMPSPTGEVSWVKAPMRCACQTPLAGTSGWNRWACGDGSSPWCTSTGTCFAEWFPKSDTSLGCSTATMCSCQTRLIGTSGWNRFVCSDNTASYCSAQETCFAPAFQKGGPACSSQVLCRCRTPSQGKAGFNRFACSDGTDDWCAADESCFSEAFPKSDRSMGCSTTNVRSVVGPVTWASSSKCLDVPGRTGHVLQLWDCSPGHTGQQFVLPPSGSGIIRYDRTLHLCLAVQGPIIDGSLIGLALCDKTSSNQLFRLPSSGQGPIVLQSSPGLCLENLLGASQNGNPIKLKTCQAGIAPQQFIVPVQQAA